MARKYRVVKIISSSKIVINGGSDDGLTVGDRFQISGENGEEVFDPESNQSLGCLTTKKAVVEITTVMERMAICESISKSIMGTSFLEGYRPPLKVNPDDITGGAPENTTSEIQLGDTALQISRSRM